MEPQSTVIDKINSPGFEQRAFISSKILNPTLTPEVIEVPDKDNGVDDDDPRNLFHTRVSAIFSKSMVSKCSEFHCYKLIIHSNFSCLQTTKKWKSGLRSYLI